MATDAFYAPGDNGRDARTIAQLCGHVVFLGMLPCNRDKRLVVTTVEAGIGLNRSCGILIHQEPSESSYRAVQPPSVARAPGTNRE
jgi:hypothetical protein